MTNSLTIDTIAAIATPPGVGGVGIVRISGPGAKNIAEQICQKTLRPRYAHFSKFFDAQKQLIDMGVVLYFAAPNSFTGEDVVELQGHGGPIILDLLLRAVFSHGARMAKAGEFSERAFLNNKMDLAQAEAVADLIASHSEQAAKAALRSLEGEFSKQVHELVQQIIHVRMYVEAAIDFPEEEIDFLSDGKVLNLIQGLLAQLEKIMVGAKQGAILQEGLTLVIVGEPNAGKSSLLNVLSGKDSAIVTPIAGTTRDILREYIQIDGLPIHLLDTAGLRESSDPVEQEGIRRAKAAIQKADHLLLVTDANSNDVNKIEQQWQITQQLLEKAIPCTILLNKSDLLAPEKLLALQALLKKLPNTSVLNISALTGEGISSLKTHLKNLVSFNENYEGAFSARRRDFDALIRAKNFI
jgi:tRNA modification GTPase